MSLTSLWPSKKIARNEQVIFKMVTHVEKHDKFSHHIVNFPLKFKREKRGISKNSLEKQILLRK